PPAGGGGPRRGHPPGQSAPARRGRIALSTRSAPTRHLSLQAYPDPRGRLSIAAQEYAAAVPPTDCGGVGGAGAGERHPPAQAPAAPFHGGRAYRQGAALLAAGRATRAPALGEPGGSAPPPYRSGPPDHTARHPGTGSARAGPTDGPGARVDGHAGGLDPRSGADLRPGPGVVRAGRRDAPALPVAPGGLALLLEPGGLTDGPGARGPAPRPGPACGGPAAPPGGALRPGEHVIPRGRLPR